MRYLYTSFFVAVIAAFFVALVSSKRCIDAENIASSCNAHQKALSRNESWYTGGTVSTIWQYNCIVIHTTVKIIGQLEAVFSQIVLVIPSHSGSKPYPIFKLLNLGSFYFPNHCPSSIAILYYYI